MLRIGILRNQTGRGGCLADMMGELGRKVMAKVRTRSVQIKAK